VSQPGDESDLVFILARNREVMERMVASGAIGAGAGQQIATGTSPHAFKSLARNRMPAASG
jgi:hypothetical protein